jgi:hypothetical protein
VLPVDSWVAPLCTEAAALLRVCPSTTECAAVAEAALWLSLQASQARAEAGPAVGAPGSTGPLLAGRSKVEVIGAAAHTLASLLVVGEEVARGVGAGVATGSTPRFPRLRALRLAGWTFGPLLTKLVASVEPHLRLLQRALKVAGVRLLLLFLDHCVTVSVFT